MLNLTDVMAAQTDCTAAGGDVRFIAFFDGACTTNPGGTASYGAVIIEGKKVVWKCSQSYSPPEGRETETTSNVAEYAGILAVLNFFIENGLTAERIVVQGDSDLVIKQCFGNWQIKKKGRLYENLADEVRAKLQEFKAISGRWIPREQNTIADELSKAVQR
jgi:ribonuclease HI